MVVVEEIDDIDSDEEVARRERPWERVGMEDSNGKVIGVEKKDEKEEDGEDGEDYLDAYYAEEKRRVAEQFAKGEMNRKKGNELLAQEDYDGAVSHYKKAHHELQYVGNEPDDRKRHTKESLVLYLNEALAHLKNGALKEAMKSADMALMTDATNVKALYRRGLAKARMARETPSYQDEEAISACADFEALLEIEPTNAEFRRELHQLRQELRDSKLAMKETQQQIWGGKLGGRTESDEPEKPYVPPPTIRACTEERHVAISLEGVTLSQKGEIILNNLCIGLRVKWCVGLHVHAESTMNALVKLITKQIAPDAGMVSINEKEKMFKPRGKDKLTIDHWTLYGVSSCLAVVLIALAVVGAWLPLVLCTITFGMIVVGMTALVGEKTADFATVVVLSAKGSLPGGSTIEALIGSHLPKELTKKERRERVVTMLRAIGFHLHPDSTPDTLEKQISDGLRVRQLSEGQKQLINILICIAKRPTMLVCNEPLAGVEESLQPRVLRMLTRMKQEFKIGLFYLSADLAQLRVVSDSLGLLVEGGLRELGPTGEVLTCPRSEEMKELLAGDSNGKGRGVMANNEIFNQYVTLAREKDLTADWLPNKNGFMYKDSGIF